MLHTEESYTANTIIKYYRTYTKGVDPKGILLTEAYGDTSLLELYG